MTQPHTGTYAEARFQLPLRRCWSGILRTAQEPIRYMARACARLEAECPDNRLASPLIEIKVDPIVKTIFRPQ
jgi:hypothetical protein